MKKLPFNETHTLALKRGDVRFYLIVFLSVCCSFLGLMCYSLFTSAVNQDDGIIYYLKPGTTKKVLVTELSQAGVLQYPRLFSLYIYLKPNSYLKTGEYFFSRGTTPYAMWKQVTTGKGVVYHPFTIIPGWSFRQLRQELLQTFGLRHRSKELTDQQVMDYLGYPRLMPEGEFFPDTYYYTRGISDLVILKEAFNLMQRKVYTLWEKRAPGLPYADSYEALIAASLIEKEAQLDSERPIIAGVLINRLRHDMLLQFDPTVIYGLGEQYDGKIHKEDLLKDTAYNTYLHKGLPPTPIAMPSLASIQAALHPQYNNYYYFVAKGDGSHTFSKSLEEHQAKISALAPAMKQPEWLFNATKIRDLLNYVTKKPLEHYSENYR